MTEMKKYWLITTEHLEDALWFRDDEDFITGMNYVAIQAALTPEVIVLVFILMSNHVHFVLYGAREEVEAFVNEFKKRYSVYYSARWGIKKFLKHNGLDIKEIPYNDEAPERAIAYVQMNCVAANICLHPGQYPWGTGNCFFNPTARRANVWRPNSISPLFKTRLSLRLFRTFAGACLERIRLRSSLPKNRRSVCTRYDSASAQM